MPVLSLPSRPASPLFFRLPPPSRSTLFPYTTLFRSVRPRALRRAPLGGAGGAGAARFRPRGLPRRRTHRSEEPRLNSSHLGISYAVFCLKKKTTTSQLSPPARLSLE